MGKIVVTEFVSLDGVMEDPGGDGNFKHKGWTFKFNRGEAGEKFKVDETRDSEALLLGRVTYEGFAAAWPSRDGEFADKFNSMPKYVVSSTLEKADWNNSTVLKGDVLQEVSKLKHRLDGNIVVHGSAQLVQTLLANDLVDEPATPSACSSWNRRRSVTASPSSSTNPSPEAGRLGSGDNRVD